MTVVPKQIYLTHFSIWPQCATLAILRRECFPVVKLFCYILLALVGKMFLPLLQSHSGPVATAEFYPMRFNFDF
jgi:hypothetical protein